MYRVEHFLNEHWKPVAAYRYRAAADAHARMLRDIGRREGQKWRIRAQKQRAT